MSGNDAIIGVAFRYSLIVFAVIALVVGGIWWFVGGQGDKDQDIAQAAPRAPQQAAVEKDAEATASLPVFTNITEESGVDFQHINGATGERLLPETMGGGVIFLDFDQDGDQDLLLTGSNYWPWDPDRRSLQQTLALFQNDGRGHFQRVDQQLGLITQAYGMGAAVADFNADGFPDIFLTHVGSNQLFVNQQGQRFEERSEQAGIQGGDQWSTAAAWFDYDGDGWLDLVVGNYVEWNQDLDRQVNYSLAGIGRAYGPPTNFPGTQLQLFRNLGDGTFSDVSASAGVHVTNSEGAAIAKTLAILPLDINRDRQLDLIVANDTTKNFALVNQSGVFRDASEELGLAFDNTGKATGAMGLDAIDAGSSLGWTVAIANFANEMTSFYVQFEQDGIFTDDAAIAGIGARTREALGFSLFFFDANLDGGLDMLQTNGHVEVEINRVQPSQHYRQPPQLFLACLSASCQQSYRYIDPQQLGALAEPVAGRGAAYADIDLDGDLDIVISEVGGKARVFRNDSDGGHWLRFTLTGHHPNTDALGADLTLSYGDQVQYRQVMPYRGYLSQMESPVTFGMGDFDGLAVLDVRWPDGSSSRHQIEQINKNYDIVQSKSDD